MCEPTPEEIKEIEAEFRAEKGRECEWENSENMFLREEKAYLARIDEHIKNQGQI